MKSEQLTDSGDIFPWVVVYVGAKWRVQNPSGEITGAPFLTAAEAYELGEELCTS